THLALCLRPVDQESDFAFQREAEARGLTAGENAAGLLPGARWTPGPRIPYASRGYCCEKSSDGSSGSWRSLGSRSVGLPARCPLARQSGLCSPPAKLSWIERLRHRIS